MLRTSGFVDDVMFSHNGANGSESSKTVCFSEFVKWQQQSVHCLVKSARWWHLE